MSGLISKCYSDLENKMEVNKIYSILTPPNNVSMQFWSKPPTGLEKECEKEALRTLLDTLWLQGHNEYFLSVQFSPKDNNSPSYRNFLQVNQVINVGGNCLCLLFHIPGSLGVTVSTLRVP